MMRLRQKTDHTHNVPRYAVLLFVCLLLSQQVMSQYKFRYDNDQLATLTYGPEENNGFRVSVSLVAMFTTGSADRNGFRLGAGITLSQTIGDWAFMAGMDAYKAKQKFGIGTAFAGTIYDDDKYGGSYLLNRYFQGDCQISGLLGLHVDDFRVRFEDDILAYPFTGLRIYDRYRSAALELSYKGFLFGTNVYTSDINGITDFSPHNSKGVYLNGLQISSPIYVGYATNGMIFRIGSNNRTGGLVGQNGWHRYVFDTPDFKEGSYNNFFLQLGVDKPYTLY